MWGTDQPTYRHAQSNMSTFSNVESYISSQILLMKKTNENNASFSTRINISWDRNVIDLLPVITFSFQHYINIDWQRNRHNNVENHKIKTFDVPTISFQFWLLIHTSKGLNMTNTKNIKLVFTQHAHAVYRPCNLSIAHEACYGFLINLLSV